MPNEIALLFVIGALVVICLILMLVIHDMRTRANEDTIRLNTMQFSKWRVSCIDGRFGILSNDPAQVLGIGSDPDLRVALDGAIAEARSKAEGVIRGTPN